MRRGRTHLDMSFDLGPQLLEVLHDGAVDRSTEVCVLVCDDAGFVADAVVYILCGPRRKHDIRRAPKEIVQMGAGDVDAPVTRPRPRTGSLI
jgi:hypothetical protein